MPSDSTRSSRPIERVLLERGDDQQHQVGAVRASLVHLVARDDEVLAQHRHLDRRTDRDQVIEAAAEPSALGEHRHAPSAAGRVLAGQFGRVGDLGQRRRATATTA